MAPGTSTPFPGTIHVTGDGVDTQIPVGPDGSYSLAVSPGRYTVVGHSPSLIDNGAQVPCGTADGGPVTVTAGQTITVDVGCPLR